MTAGQGLKCIVLLSVKSSGSTAVQRRVTQFGGVNHIRYTPHAENETLYWTKAASVLGLPQVKLPDSEVPIPKDRARRSLVEMLEANAPDFAIPADDEALIHDGWEALCRAFAPVFFEKSPHHLSEQASLELMRACESRKPNIAFRYVGLVRNPMDTIYSMWTRWRIHPETGQRYWRDAYRNLLTFEAETGDQLTRVRYEDVIEDDACLAPVYAFIGAPPPSPSDNTAFHKGSLAKWRQDATYGFELSDEVVELAESFGYERAELKNKRVGYWPLYSRLVPILHAPRKTARRLLGRDGAAKDWRPAAQNSALD